MRRGTQTSALNALELSEMMYNRGVRNWELEPAYNATLDDIDEEKVQVYLDRRRASGSHVGRFKDLAKVLIRMRCAITTTDEKTVPTNAGILFFGSSPQWHILQAVIVPPNRDNYKQKSFACCFEKP